MNLRRAVFLDRDGTLNPDPGYISRPEDYHLFPGVGKQLRRLRDAGFLLVLVTNQAGIARGIIPPGALDRVHDRMKAELAAEGVALDAIYFCPHHPDFPTPDQPGPCLCRKPAPGMVLRAQAELGLDLTASFAIGDRISDCQMALNAGVRAILLADPREPVPSLPLPQSLDEGGRIAAPPLEGIRVAVSFAEAVDWIVSQA